VPSGLPSLRDVILDRLDASSTPGTRTDEHRVILAVEGGGMRGAVSSGMLLALEQLGLRNSFDEVIGTSAGAIAGAFFVTGQGTRGSVLYYTVLNSERFLHRRRLLGDGSIMDLDYLIDDALDQHGFIWDDLISSDVPLFATVTPVDPDNPTRLFAVGGSEGRARRVLAASAALPVIAGRSRFVDDRAYVDGGMTDAVPWSTAIDRGATHVLVARSRGFNKDGQPEDLNVFERATVPRLVKRMHGEHVADVVTLSAQRFWNSTESLRSVVEETGSPVAGGGRPVEVDVVLPPPDVDLPDRLELDTHVLMDALTAGAQSMVEYLDIEGFAVEQRVVVTHPRAPVGKVRTTALSPIVSDRRHFTRPK
jgi:predicted patatin/cPLA2 family phospholipase